MKRIITILACLFLLICVVACGSSVVPSENPDLVYTQAAQTVVAEFTQQAEAAASAPETIPTSEPEPTEAPTISTRENPVPFSQPFMLVYDDTANFEMKVTNVIRGEEAWQKIYAANMYNDPPLENMEYLLANINIIFLTSGQADLLMDFGTLDFQSVSNNQLFPSASIIEPEPKLDISLFPGGQSEGFVALLVYRDDPAPLVVFEKFLSGTKYYFAAY